MAVRETMTVSFTPQLRAFVQERLRSGRYGNASEVVRAALRLLAEREQQHGEVNLLVAENSHNAR